MYLEYFSLNLKPFELLPNPEFMFPSEVHKKTLTFLEYGLQEHTGFILFTGEVGTGKTTLIRMLLEKMNDDITVAKVFNTQLNSDQLLRMINDDFGIPGSGTDKADMLRDLNDFLIREYAAGRHAILIVDEAQNLGPEQLEQIRLLSNLETSHCKLLQIILVGQPELRDKLSSPSLLQLRQRILVHSHLTPLSEQETSSYILHRLEYAGNRDAVHWHDGTLKRVHSATRGIPRLINILCDYILLDAFSANRRDVTQENLEDILTHLDFEAQFWPSGGPAAALPATPIFPGLEYSAGGQNLAETVTKLRDATRQLNESALSLQNIVVAFSDFAISLLELYKKGSERSADGTSEKRM